MLLAWALCHGLVLRAARSAVPSGLHRLSPAFLSLGTTLKVLGVIHTFLLCAWYKRPSLLLLLYRPQSLFFLSSRHITSNNQGSSTLHSSGNTHPTQDLETPTRKGKR